MLVVRGWGSWLPGDAVSAIVGFAAALHGGDEGEARPLAGLDMVDPVEVQLLGLPDELWEAIFHHLRPAEVVRVSSASMAANALCHRVRLFHGLVKVESGAVPLAAQGRWGDVFHLHHRCNVPDAVGEDDMLSHMLQMHSLDLSGLFRNTLTGPGAADRLADALRGSPPPSRVQEDCGRCRHGLHSLNFAHNRITDEGVRVLAKALASPQCANLGCLNIAANGIRHSGAHSLAHVLAEGGSWLTSLDVSFNAVGPVGIGHLAASLGTCRLVSLVADVTACGDEGAYAMAAALSEGGCQLEKLSLKSNQISGEGTLALASAVLGRRRMDVDLSNNEASDIDAKALSCIMHKAQSCGGALLSLFGCQMTPVGHTSVHRAAAKLRHSIGCRCEILGELHQGLSHHMADARPPARASTTADRMPILLF